MANTTTLYKTNSRELCSVGGTRTGSNQHEWIIPPPPPPMYEKNGVAPHFFTEYFFLPKEDGGRSSIIIMKLEFGRTMVSCKYNCAVQDIDYTTLTEQKICGGGCYTFTFSNNADQPVRIVFTPLETAGTFAVPVRLKVSGSSLSRKKAKDSNAPYTYWKGHNEKTLQQLFSDGIVLRFIKANFANPGFFDSLHKIYNYFRYMEVKTFADIFRHRIEKDTVASIIESQYGKENNIVILSDIQESFGPYPCRSIDEIDTITNRDDCLFVPVYNKDWLGNRAVNELSRRGLKYHLLKYWTCPPVRYFLTDEKLYQTLQDENANNPSGQFAPQDYENLAQAIQAVKDIDGDYVEIGTYQGDSARFALNYFQRASITKRTWFLDTFEGFTYDTAWQSENAGWENICTDTSMEAVKEYLAEFPGANLVKRNIVTDELPLEIERIALCNIDVDLYDAIKAALYKVDKRLAVNGIIIVQDYGSSPALIGAQKAFHEFFEEKNRDYISLYMGNRQLFLIKRGERA